MNDVIANGNYFYDANGNLQCITAAAQCDGTAARSIAVTSFNMTETVGPGTSQLALTYDPDHARAEMCLPDCISHGPTSVDTQYMNDPNTGTMSELVTAGASITWRNYILADGKMVAERFKTGSGAATFDYFITDHLGSVAVVTDSTGTVLSNGRLFYDPWGKMKLAGGGNDTNCALPQVPSGSPTTRGFTGQEQMPNICADNFNARVYNPLLGRFLSPDSVIPDTYAPQSLNRYTYVDNMPLSVTDPTGHSCAGWSILCVGGSDDGQGAACSCYASGPGVTSTLATVQGGLQIRHSVADGLGIPDSDVSVTPIPGGYSVQASGWQFTEVDDGTTGDTFSFPVDGSGIIAAIVSNSNASSGGNYSDDGSETAGDYGSTDRGSVATSHDITMRMVQDADRITPSWLVGNAERAADRMKKTFVAYPSDLPDDLQGEDIKVIYVPKAYIDHGRAIGADHLIDWHASEKNGQVTVSAPAGIHGNTIFLYQGSSNDEQSALKLLFHEVGHHSPDAVAVEMRIMNSSPLGVNANINTSEVETDADNFSDRMMAKALQ
jgi:RHS repeat-associated protein